MYRALGRTGLRVSRVGVGLWQAGSWLWGARGQLRGVREAVLRALELGINLFDTAELYGGGASERLLGEVLREAGEDAVVATKVAGFRTTVDSIVKAAEASRRRLGRAPDLLLHHWPPPFYVDVCRVVRGLEEAVERGLAGYIGVSNYPQPLLARAMECTRRFEIAVNQVHYSLGYRVVENRLKPFMDRHGVALQAWSPLDKGALAGKTRADNMARRLDPVFRAVARDGELQRVLGEAAERLGASKAVVAAAWLVAKGAFPLVGVRKRSHAEAVAEAARLELPSSIVEELGRASERYRTRWGTCYSELRWSRAVPGPLQALLFRYLLRGV